MAKRYGSGVLALDGVSLSVSHGARVCLLGPNGAGKTTLVRLLIGVLRPSAGTITLNGRPAGQGTLPRGVGYVAQSPGMYPDLTVGEYIDLARRLGRGASPDSLVELLGLTPHLSKRLAELSGGFQRRIALLAALLGDPELLILDEPTVGLDPLAAHDVRAHLSDVMRDRTTLLCTHDLAEAEQLCSEVAILREGRLVVHTTISELRRRSRSSARLRVDGPAERAVDVARRHGMRAELRPDGLSVDLDERDSNVPRLLAALAAADVDVRECRVDAATLEDMFVSTVSERDS